MSCPSYDGMMSGLRRYLLPCGDLHRPKFAGHKTTTCSPPWPSHQLTLTPLGIRRNMSRVAHNPGTTAAGMQCTYVDDLCMHLGMHQPACAAAWICDCRHTCCATGLVCVRPVGHSTKTWLDPAFACARSTTPRIRGMGWGAVVNPAAANNRGRSAGTPGSCDGQNQNLPQN